MRASLGAVVAGALLHSPLAAAGKGPPLQTSGTLPALWARETAGLSPSIEVVLLLTLLTALPAILIAITPLLRITVVLHFLRQALGTQTAPSNQVLAGMALFLTLLIMKPVAGEAYSAGWLPYEKGEVNLTEGLIKASAPWRKFLLKYCREKDLQLFLELGGSKAPPKPEDLDFITILPAYVLSELRTSFQIGTMLFLPFLIVDIVVASITLSIGMVQLPPIMVSAPFKILLFVLADGWNLVVGSLMRSFQVAPGA